MPTNLELSRFLKLLHVALTLERTACCQENILVVSIDVLNPIGEPRHGFVVNDGLPLAGHVGLGNRNAVSDVDRDVLGMDTELWQD